MSQLRKIISAYEEPKKRENVSFEEAITLAEMGKFQVGALLCSGLSLFAVLVETSAVSYLLPAAECELHLSLAEKGLLGSGVFIGFACSALLWGAVGDVWGRRKTMMSTLFLCALSTLGSSLAPSFLPLLLCRIFSGFFSCAASGLLYVYAGEFCNNSRRPRAVVTVACLGAAGVNLVPTLAWTVIPRPWTFLIPGLPLITSWRIYLGLCSIPSFAATFVLLFCLPESPKFLLGRGRNKEALEVCKTVFHVNTGKPKSEYPVGSIASDEADGGQISEKKVSILRVCWNQTAPLFGRDLLGSTLMVFFLQGASFFGFTALIMFLPEMFNRLSDRVPGTATLCDVMNPDIHLTEVNLLEEALDAAGHLFPIEGPTYNSTDTCDPTIEDHVFLYALFLTASGWIGNVLAGILINHLGKRNLYVCMNTVATALIAAVPYIKHPVLLLVVYCASVGFSGAGPGILAAASLDLFPTNLKGMAACLSMMAGRLGAVFSAMVFGTLLDVRCELSFFICCGALAGGVLLGTRLPKK